jgi:hypothetical protein
MGPVLSHAIKSKAAKGAHAYLLLPTAMTRCHLTGGICMSACLWAESRRLRRVIVGHTSGMLMRRQHTIGHDRIANAISEPPRRRQEGRLLRARVLLRTTCISPSERDINWCFQLLLLGLCVPVPSVRSECSLVEP